MINKKRNKNPLVQGYTDPSLPVPDINERFVDACENGDYPTVTRILESIKDFNIDVTDNLGRTALRLAVENEHLEVVQALLSRSDSAKMKEALLLAIYLGHTQIAESILRHPKYKVLNEKKFVNGDTDSFWQTPSSDDAQFSPDITPLMLAAQYNRTEIVQILLINGDRITKPHDFHCKCNECFNRFKFDSLRHAQSRLNAFRGLASESYISLASMDPILTSFELGHELRNLATKEKYFKNEYLQLADNLSIYVCRLLNNVRGRDELEIVLNKTGKETEEKYERLARLDLAIKYEEKPFVAHSNCQQKLVEIWYTGLRKVSKMNQLFTFLLLIAFLFMLPFNIAVYLIAPKSKLGRFMYQPCVKFMSHTISYMVFIIMIIVSSFQFSDEEKNFLEFYDYLPANFTDEYEIYMNNTDLTFHLSFPNYHFKIRHDKPTVMDILITIWIAGFIWQEIKQLYHYGAKDYLRSWNNIFNSLMNVIYVSSFSLKYYTMIVVRLTKAKVLDEKFWLMAANLNQTDYASQKDVYNTIYWLNNDRFFWVSMDPINMAEGLFAIANLFSFIRICFLLPANQQLGPLQISLGNMISDIMKFVSIFTIIFLAFMFALNNLFWYYQKSVRQPIELTDIQDDIQAEVNFGTIIAAFGSMFWALFGLGDPNKVNLSPYQNQLTQVFGLLLYGAYHIASIIVLLNMLIASMTQSFERILHESDIEWKFSRSKLYMQYIRNDGTLPAPFNLIPSPKSIYYVFNLIVGLIKRNHPKPKPKANGEISNSHRPSRNVPENIHHKGGKQNQRSTSDSEELTYIKVMQRIVKRFLLHKQRESDEVGEADFDELKQDLQMVRFEMLNDLKRSRDDTNRLISTMQAGLIIIGDEVFSDSKKLSENALRFKEFKVAAASENDMNNQGEIDPLMKNSDEMTTTTKSIEHSVSDPNFNHAVVRNADTNLDISNATVHKLVSFSTHVNTISASVDSSNRGQQQQQQPQQKHHDDDTLKAMVDKTSLFTDLATVKIPLQDLDIIKEEDEVVEVKINVNNHLKHLTRERTEEDNSV